MAYIFSLSGAIPALLAMLYVDWLDRKRPEPPSLLRRVAVLGALSCLPCGILELLLMKVAGISADFSKLTGYTQVLMTAFVIAAAVEEGAKVFVLRVVAWRFAAFDERLDGIVYATRAGLGFALVENVFYLASAKTAWFFLVMFFFRAVLTVPMHAASAAIMGYYAAVRRFDGTGPGLLGGYVLAILVHGTFDAGLLAMIVTYRATKSAAAFGFAVISLAVVAWALFFARGLARRALSADNAAISMAQAAS